MRWPLLHSYGNPHVLSINIAGSSSEVPYFYPIKVKSSPCASLIKHYPMKMYGRVDEELPIFLTSAMAELVKFLCTYLINVNRKQFGQL
jgi:hypothetical protein